MDYDDDDDDRDDDDDNEDDDDDRELKDSATNSKVFLPRFMIMRET